MAVRKRLIVLEANEVPDRVVKEAISRGRAPNLKALLDSGLKTDTLVTEEIDRYLYPSQSWASMNTAAPFAEHNIYWYGDPKPDNLPMYWQTAAAQGTTVGLVGALHSSPLNEQCNDPNFVFAIPDCFASTPDTIPARYRHVQRANIELTAQAGRTASASANPGAILGLLTAQGLGLRPKTSVELAKLVVDVGRGAIRKERLRSAQHMIMSDLFSHLCQAKDPDLAVYFTNHIAAMMHRYWYGLFPQDWAKKQYSDEWVQKYEDEILAAVELFDGFLGRVMDWAKATNRMIAITSSMGQKANQDIDPTSEAVYVVRDEAALAKALGLESTAEPVSAMVPTQSWDLGSADAAHAHGERLKNATIEGLDLQVDVAGSVLSVEYHSDANRSEFVLNGQTQSFEDAGFHTVAIDDHNSGVHDERGIFYLWGAPEGTELKGEMDALEVTPFLLELLGLQASVLA